MSTIVGAQLGENVLHMRLDGFLGEVEEAGDLLVRAAVGDLSQHVRLAFRQGMFAGVLGDPHGDLGRNPATADVAAHLDLKDAIHIGHSTGGGEVARYVARYGAGGRVAKAVLIGAVPPVMAKSEKNPGGLPLEVFDGFRAALIANRAQFYRDVPAGPFYGFNRPGAKMLDGVIDNWWRQGMMGGIKPQYDCIKAFSETDFTNDLQQIDVPTLVMHGDDDQIVPIADSAPLSAKLLRKGTLKIYPGLGHGLCTINAERVNGDLLGFICS